MGLFSFLTSKGSDESTTAASGADREPTAAPAALPEEPAPDSAAGTGADEASAEPSAGWGMDTSALTAPSPAPPADAPSIGEPDPELTAELQGKIVDVIKTVYDPEIPVDIYELGLIYDIIVDTERKVQDDVFVDISIVRGNAHEGVGYDTQKPQKLLERLITALCPPSGTVADFFCGSGTTGAAANSLSASSAFNRASTAWPFSAGISPWSGWPAAT